MAPPTSAAHGGAGTPASGAAPTCQQLHADDAAYHAPPSASAVGVKRVAGERADGEPRAKRKRVDASATAGAASSAAGHSASGSSGLTGGKKDQANGEGKINLVHRLLALPSAAVFEYLMQYDLVPDVEPSPLGPDDPSPPSALLRPRSQPRRHASTASPAPGVEPVVPVLADVHEVHGVLAQVAQRHFREHTVKEVDALASFMYALKAKVRMGS
ncbi:uncharacterized protein B0H18DRAFT_1024778 [Fomitopsis serialis]|uniref:uncharacterized protein n=1 Tax=Fomitopsis serialis TaxID=139415 RepID=UPI002007C41F|nr:uncharacterized protein B0H18DRAFT_1024778 [Neoantrodia serialis]KAH9920311.1 hypothetical protein B0H18DRAFT_1024778 [Neoantrodia serialis]